MSTFAVIMDIMTAELMTSLDVREDVDPYIRLADPDLQDYHVAVTIKVLLVRVGLTQSPIMLPKPCFDFTFRLLVHLIFH